MSRSANLLIDGASASRLGLLHADRVEADWSQSGAASRRAAVAARAPRIGLGLLEKLRADDGIRGAPHDRRAETLPFNEIKTVAQRRRIAHERAVVDVDGRPFGRSRQDARLTVGGRYGRETEYEGER